MRLFVIRHGQTAWNVEQRAQGHTDIPLDELGESQARALSLGFPGDAGLGAIYSSDLCRCHETARPLASRLGCDLMLEPLLRERKFGDWEGLHFRDFSKLNEAQMAKHRQKPVDVRPPDGESLQDLWERIGVFFEELRCSDQSLAVVTHGGCGAMLLSRLILGTVLTARSFRLDNASITELHRRPDGLFSMIRYNDVSHLCQGSYEPAH